MPIRVEIGDEAYDDLHRIIDELWAISESLAHRFADDYERTVLTIVDFPESGVARGRLRWLPIGRSGFALLYRLLPTALAQIVVIDRANSTRMRPG